MAKEKKEKEIIPNPALDPIGYAAWRIKKGFEKLLKEKATAPEGQK
jgi:hypothetical protein